MDGQISTDIPPVSPFEEDDDDQSTIFSFPLELDELRSGQLGSHVYKNFNESHPRELITAKRSSAYYFHARCRCHSYGLFYKDHEDPIQGGPNPDPKDLVPAALIVLDLSFQRRASDDTRFKMAEIEFEFYDAATVLLNHHERSDVFEDQYVPTVLHFEPRHFEGPVVSALGETKKGLSLSVSDPTNTVSLSPSISQTTPFALEGFSVHGVKENDPPSKIHWVIREDKLTKAGIRAEMSVAVIVGYTPGRKFAARVRIKADVASPLVFVKPVAGAKDDPLYFDAGGDDGRDPIILPRDLRKLTRLDASGGMWLT
ncbi:hypothetical protein F5884DRAFT_248124 [Xylogone sp. PMI_703]|nr:hypothetical protein F5884DRAFT_248124 [Xylogone sp. PMI_703]